MSRSTETDSSKSRRIFGIAPESLELLIHKHMAIPRMFATCAVVIDEVRFIVFSDRGGLNALSSRPLPRTGRRTASAHRRSAAISDPERTGAFSLTRERGATVIPLKTAPRMALAGALHHRLGSPRRQRFEARSQRPVRVQAYRGGGIRQHCPPAPRRKSQRTAHTRSAVIVSELRQSRSETVTSSAPKASRHPRATSERFSTPPTRRPTTPTRYTFLSFEPQFPESFFQLAQEARVKCAPAYCVLCENRRKRPFPRSSDDAPASLPGRPGNSAMRSQRAQTTVTTSTLELEYMISAHGACLPDRRAFTVSSFLQRMGRTGTPRSSARDVVLLYCTHEEEPSHLR